MCLRFLESCVELLRPFEFFLGIFDLSMHFSFNFTSLNVQLWLEDAFKSLSLFFNQVCIVGVKGKKFVVCSTRSHKRGQRSFPFSLFLPIFFCWIWSFAKIWDLYNFFRNTCGGCRNTISYWQSVGVYKRTFLLSLVHLELVAFVIKVVLSINSVVWIWMWNWTHRVRII